LQAADEDQLTEPMFVGMYAFNLMTSAII